MLTEGEGDELRGPSALARLSEVLRGEGGVESRFAEPPLTRLAGALQGTARATPLDRAVLVRHVLRYASVQPEATGPLQLVVPSGKGWPQAHHWRAVGVAAQQIAGGYLVTAQPWQPCWLPGCGQEGVDAAAAGARIPAERPRRPDGDPFLAWFGLSTYQSEGQRAAVRAALTMPPGGTLLVCLPTGEGKSFVFQALARCGFGDSPEPGGVTLVVVPTVALALDQERAAREMGLVAHGAAYQGGGGHAEANRQLAERIAEGRQGLCFASPEAVCTALRRPLLEAARRGALRAIVVDEAHLVDAWGMDFRPEFQVLSGVRRELLAAAEGVPAVRTLLLSATLTPGTVMTLAALFGKGEETADGLAVCAAARLRPEIEYWIAPDCSPMEQEARVCDALLHLPRPAILYVSRVDAAERWYAALRELGFGRLACVTGRSDRRQEVVEGWRANTIDLVVGTSAFGLGIDNPHVRAVIHACVPEGIDRFYQEVGRGGRDGGTSLSLIVPTEVDREVARGLSKPKLITTDVGLPRWRAMFQHSDRQDHGDDMFTVRLDVPPGYDARHIDMDSARNTEWNLHTLTLMAGSGLLQLLGHGRPPQVPPEAAPADEEAAPLRDWGEYQTVKIRNPAHLAPEEWARAVEPQRQVLYQAQRENLRQMWKYLRGRDCVADVLAPVYTVDLPATPERPAIHIPVARACGGCVACRESQRPAWSEPPARPAFPWSAVSPLQEMARRLLDASQRLVVFYPPDPSNWTRRERRRFAEALSDLVKAGVRNAYCLPGSPVDGATLQESAGDRPVFVSSSTLLDPLPPGPALIVVPPGGELHAHQLAPRASAADARFYFLPEGFSDPRHRSTPLRDRYEGRWLSLLEFQQRVKQ